MSEAQSYNRRSPMLVSRTEPDPDCPAPLAWAHSRSQRLARAEMPPPAPSGVPTAFRRLLTDEQAANYLSLPLASMKRMAVGRVVVDGRVRWDRNAIDAWLDRESGLAAPVTETGGHAAADRALDGWLEDAKYAARRS